MNDIILGVWISEGSD